MKFQQPDKVDAMVATLVAGYLDKGDRAKLTDSSLADLAGISKMTLYKYRKALPDRRLATINFLNLLVATQVLDQGFTDGVLPVRSRSQGRQFVTQARRARSQRSRATQER